MKILIIEDDAKTARAIRKGLSGEGSEAAVAKTGEEGFFLLNAESFNLVSTDQLTSSPAVPFEYPHSHESNPS